MDGITDLLNPAHFSDRANYNGGSLLLIVSCLTLCFYTVVWLRDEMRASQIPWHSILCINRTRLLFAWALAGFAIAAGSIIWWPVGPLLIAADRYEIICGTLGDASPVAEECRRLQFQAEQTTEWFVETARWPANVANLLVSVSSTIVMWLPISYWLGRWAIPVVAASAGLIYYLGGLATRLLAPAPFVYPPV